MLSGQHFTAETFSPSARILRTLGHPVRLKIVTGLTRHPSCVKDIWECLELPQAVVSQHLAILKSSGIIEGTRKGSEMHYAVIDPLARQVVEHLVDGDDRKRSTYE